MYRYFGSTSQYRLRHSRQQKRVASVLTMDLAAQQHRDAALAASRDQQEPSAPPQEAPHPAPPPSGPRAPEEVWDSLDEVGC
jgi:hypothetical protein